ncbi:uncharacterized protein LOC114274804 [Camellia sinensis]|uniref:uncharacterized protein LOC114274804 n=1 Tax=Camellia sinensis TaxID=4442 RepID=UPI0010368800|nr:uncharacterized protein LOC114274804 [Camellia sinensis]
MGTTINDDENEEDEEDSDNDNDNDDDVANNVEKEGVPNFNKLLNDAQRELYPGCHKFSLLSFVVKMLHVKVLNKWSNKSFNMLLGILKDLLPVSDQVIPWILYEAKKFLRALGLGYVSIHACMYDCALFWKENANLENCPICQESRYKSNYGKGKKVPHKTLRYFPLTSRLQRSYMSRKTAIDMRWHKEKRVDDGILRHPVDGEAWKDFDRQHPLFSRESRNVRLGLATDGFNPFGNMSNLYSMWSVIVMPYNLPPWKCMKQAFSMLSLLIPGPQAPGRDIDVYMRPLIDELKELWEDGVLTYDALIELSFQMLVAVMWTINDFPAYGNLSGWSTKGYLACPTCNKNASSQRLRDGKNKDTGKARMDLEDMKIGKELHLKRRADGSFEKPLALYTLSSDERYGFCEFLKSIKYPDGYAANISRCVNTKGDKLTGLKSHDCHVLIQRLLPIGMRGYLHNDICVALFELENFFQELCSKTLKMKNLEILEDCIIFILCKLEKIFPPTFFDVMVHLAIHLPREAILGGPVQYRWMYPIERLLGTLKGYVANRVRPEGSITEAYVVKECLTFCSMYLGGIETVFNREERNVDVSVHESGIEVFAQNMNQLRAQGLPEATDDMWSLANGPSVNVNLYSACISNGVRFHSKDRDSSHKCQNSGLVVEGEHERQTINFYGYLNRVWEMHYMLGHRVVLFQCEWFNTGNNRTLHTDTHCTSIDVRRRWYKDDPFVLPSHVKQVFYVDDTKLGGHWKVVERLQHRGIWDVPEQDGFEPDNVLQQNETTDAVPVSVEDPVTISLHRNDIDPQIIPSEVVLQLVNQAHNDGVDEEDGCDNEDDYYEH